MGNRTSVKSKFFEPDGVDNDQVSTTGTATTLVIADGGPYGNLT